MKKRLSLFVAMLMVLTLVPFNAFAIKEKLPAVPEVADSDEVVTGFIYEIESQDLPAVKEAIGATTATTATTAATISVSLGANAYFRDATLWVGGRKCVVNDKMTMVDGEYFSDFIKKTSLKAKDVIDYKFKTVFFDVPEFKMEGKPGDELKAGSEIKLSAIIQLDNAAPGEQALDLNLKPLGLSAFKNKVYAKVPDNSDFAKADKPKVLTRGKDQELATIKVSCTPGQWIAVKSADQDGIKITNVVGTNIVGKIANPEELEEYKGKKDSDAKWFYGRATGKECELVVTVDVNRDAAKGDVEIDVYKFSKDLKDKDAFLDTKFTGEEDSATVVAGEYKDYGLTLKTKKAPKSVLADGKEYRVDLVLSADDESNIPKYIDFTVEGGNVKVAPGEGNEFEGDATKDFDDNFTMNPKNWNSKADKNFSLKVKADWDCDGEVKLKGKGRGGEEVECVILNAKPVAKLVIESKDVLNGSRFVDVNDVVIEETEPGALHTGEEFAVSLTPLKFYDVKFENEGEITSENISVDSLKLDKESETIYFTIKSRSKEAAKITISGIKIASRSSLPLGEHKLSLNHVDATEIKRGSEKEIERGTDYVYGKDWARELDFIADAPYMNIVNELGRVKKTTVFTLGSADYTVDGVAMQLDAPVFTQDNYTMLPVRAVADALGVNVLWNAENRTATFVDGDKVVSVKIGAKTLYKNGIAYPMATKASVKAERMYIPISSVGDAFGLNRDVDYTWNESTKQVTIYPQATPEKAATEKTDK